MEKRFSDEKKIIIPDHQIAQIMVIYEDFISTEK